MNKKSFHTVHAALAAVLMILLMCLPVMAGDYSLETIREEVYGLDTPVELADSTLTQAINFDNGATTPEFIDVNTEVADKLSMYGSIGRGKGQKSAASTAVYDATRDAVLRFVNADPELYTAFFCSNTTDGLNKLSSALITNESDMVLTSWMEHHANDLPLRHRGNTIYAEVDELGRIKLDEVERLLSENQMKYVTITAASNVTGYVNDVHAIAKMAHANGAQIVVDGAQIVAHRAFSMLGETPEENIDFFVFSAHKMYAPYGGGAVVGLRSELDQHMPEFYGSGIVDVVTDEMETYLAAPEFYEAGSPNYPGVVALGKAIEILQSVGFDRIQEHEQVLIRKTIDGLLDINGVTVYVDTAEISDKVGVVTFNIDGIWHADVAQALADNYGIAVRQGAFCSHPYVFRLLGISNEQVLEDMKYDDFSMPGMVRVSFGIYNTEEEVELFLNAVREIAGAATVQ